MTSKLNQHYKLGIDVINCDSVNGLRYQNTK